MKKKFAEGHEITFELVDESVNTNNEFESNYK